MKANENPKRSSRLRPEIGKSGDSGPDSAQPHPENGLWAHILIAFQEVDRPRGIMQTLHLVARPCFSKSEAVSLAPHLHGIVGTWVAFSFAFPVGLVRMILSTP